MNVVDSSAWLEYFADGPNAEAFAEPLRDIAALVVPAITIYEVFKSPGKRKHTPVVVRGPAAMLVAMDALFQPGHACKLLHKANPGTASGRAKP